MELELVCRTSTTFLPCFLYYQIIDVHAQASSDSAKSLDRKLCQFLKNHVHSVVAPVFLLQLLKDFDLPVVLLQSACSFWSYQQSSQFRKYRCDAKEYEGTTSALPDVMTLGSSSQVSQLSWEHCLRPSG